MADIAKFNNFDHHNDDCDDDHYYNGHGDVCIKNIQDIDYDVDNDIDIDNSIDIDLS